MKTFFTILVLLVSLGLSAQPYNNEWINFSNTYYKFKVGADGLYRIPQSVLAAAGLGSAPVQDYQLFRNGKEVPVYTSSQSGALASNGYIEFWGRMNDGVPDVPLYYSPVYQHTKHKSLETDTAVYFLTVNSTGNTFHYTPTANNPGSSSLPVEPYFMYNTGTYFASAINPGFAQVVGEYIYSSSYDIGEFWGSTNIVPGAPLQDSKSNLYVYNAGPNASIRFGMVGDADDARTAELTVNGTVVGDTVMNSFSDWLTTETVPVSLLSSNSITVNYINNSPVSTDWMVASFYELNYPRQFNFGGQEDFYFQLPARSAGFLLNITNVPLISGYTPVLYDEANGLQYTAVVNPDNSLSFALGGSTAARNLVLVNEDPATLHTVTSLNVKNFENLASATSQGNYLIISNPLLFTGGTNGDNAVMDYKNYRNSAAGGSFNVQIYDINELVDQFAFGIKKDPLSIQNFLRYARANFAAPPQFVLLMGYGLCYTDYNTYGEQQHNPLADQLDLVPTYGYPASDNKLSAANGMGAVPVTPIGRLSVVSGAEIENYLQKVEQYEQTGSSAPNTVAGRLWMKNALHLTGVSEPYLGTIICNYMYAYQQIIADTLTGDNVLTFCDGNASPVTQISGSAIPSLFSTGFNILNYFGHSANTALAYNLNDPSDYNNTGKYPLFYVNGCDAGDFFVWDPLRFTVDKTLSETWVLAPAKGAIAFMAATSFSIVNYVNIYLNGLYDLITGSDYAKPIGISQKDALQTLVNAVPGDFFGRQHAEQMGIHGDPFIHLYQETLPDYDVEPSTITVSPNLVTVSDNSFTFTARYFNLGKAVQDSISVLITRKYPNGTSTALVNKKIKPLLYADSIQIVVPIVSTRDAGNNVITVTINSTNTVSEVTTQNNTVATTVYIYQNTATPIYPYNYAIINSNQSHLFASTDLPLAPIQSYVMQLDTTALFNSTLKVTKNLNSTGGVLEFDPGISFEDSTVYYWRVAVVPAGGSQYVWSNASFVYIDSIRSSPGMNQSHFYQNTQSTPTNMYLDTPSRHFIFDSVSNDLDIAIGTWSTSATQEAQVAITANGYYFIHNACWFSSLEFTVFDPVTFRPWLNTTNGSGNGLYGSLSNNCSAGREYSFEFRYTDTGSRHTIMNFMDNVIPNGAYVVVRSFLLDPTAFPTFPQAYAVDWHHDTVYWGAGNSIYNRLLTQGFAAVDSFSYPRNFYFVYKKNGPGVFRPRWLFTAGTTDNVSGDMSITTPDTAATLLSPVFGPANKWGQLHWRGYSLDRPRTDTAQVQVIGVDNQGNKTPLYNLGFNNQDFDISTVSATQYPYIQLQLHTSDTISGKPYQLRYWRLNYVPVPEGALAANIYYSGKDTLSQGQPLNFGIAFKNVSPYNFADSMLINMTLTDGSNNIHSITLPKRKKLMAGDTIMINYQLSTNNYSGNNSIYLEVNPNNNQPEEYHFNNFMYNPFTVKSNGNSPTMDVTFDNVHILNDDIVSAKPHIQIRLQSQGYLLLNDTSMVTVQVQYPDGSLHSYYFSSDTVRFTPATSSSNNTATVDFTPSFTTQYNPSGDIYQLIVTGKDQSGNIIGLTPYRIGFEVINKAMISNVLNYPNPFSTSTAFVFTITGSEVPQNIKIEILTITGKVVKQITEQELGPLHIGTNITQYKWNGTDMYGQRLANGVYLYHVVTNLDGKSLQKYTATGDNTNQYFNNGYGKMYLMR